MSVILKRSSYRLTSRMSYRIANCWHIVCTLRRLGEPMTYGKTLLAISVLFMLLFNTSIARADLPRITPPPVVFSSSEISEYEDLQRSKRNKIVIGFAGGTVLALVATGIALMAVGLGTDPGSSKLTSSGVACLSVATLGTFMGLELYTW